MKHNTTLNSAKIVSTVERLGKRIEERFPGSGLSGVSQSLLELANKTEREAETIDRPIIPLRILIGVLLVLMGLLITMGIYLFGSELLALQKIESTEMVTLLEAGSNEMVLIGLAVYFLISIERRIKRRRALKAIHELRAIAHVIDMHQLTKDPSQRQDELGNTPSSPSRNLEPGYLVRYLDYCSELLSLTGKLAAMYIQRFDDEITLSAANDVEALTTQLSRKIWQKVMIAENGRTPDRELRQSSTPG